MFPCALFGCLSVLFACLGVPLLLRKVPPNVVYGVRTRETLENRELWYETNAYAGKLLIVYGGVTLLGTLILCLLTGRNKAVLGPLLLSLFLISFALVTVLVFRYLHSLKRELKGK